MRRLLFLTGILILAAAAVWVPLPLLALTPGPARAVDQGIELSGPTDDLQGAFLLTAVQLENPTTLEAAGMLVDEERELVSRRRVVPPGVDVDEFARRQERVFQESMRVAAAVGQRAAGRDVTVEGDGATVVTVLPGAPAEGHLENGDVITAVDGQEVQLASQLPVLLATRRAGDAVTLTVERDDQEQQVDIELGRVEQIERPGLGIAAQTRNRSIELAVDIEVDVDRLGGPSAGLMAALAVYDLLDDGDVLAGRTIAGTGTIDPSGNVGPVGGVTQKVAAAVDEGATLFLVPSSLVDEAREAAGGAIDVLGVETFDDALEQLRG